MATAVPQHLKALKRANEVRGERTRLKRLVASGEVPVETLILHPPECLNTRTPVTLGELLSWRPRWGRQRAESFLARRRDLRMLPSQDLSAFSEGRRKQLARAVRSV